jgi:hypothetical protein
MLKHRDAGGGRRAAFGDLAKPTPPMLAEAPGWTARSRVIAGGTSIASAERHRCSMPDSRKREG